MQRSTVYDLAALKLHPDGTRAGSKTHKQGRHVQDSRGNVLAIDAAGPTRIPKRPLVGSSSGEEDSDLAESSRRDASRGASRESSSIRDYRARKRRAFEVTKLEFLGPQKSLVPTSMTQLSCISVSLLTLSNQTARYSPNLRQ